MREKNSMQISALIWSLWGLGHAWVWNWLRICLGVFSEKILLDPGNLDNFQPLLEIRFCLVFSLDVCWIVVKYFRKTFKHFITSDQKCFSTYSTCHIFRLKLNNDILLHLQNTTKDYIVFKHFWSILADISIF